MDLDRRRMLRAGALAALAGLASCRQRAAAEDPDPRAVDPPDELLLHVMPDDARTRDIGHMLGIFLVLGDDEQLAPLATTEMRGATTDELRTIAPQLATGSVRAVLLRSGRPPASAVVATVGDPPPRLVRGVPVVEAAEHERSIRERHTWFARQVGAALAIDRAELERRAAREHAPALDAHAPDEAARRWPWSARLRAEQMPEQRATWIAALAAVARERWRLEAPAGSTWATSNGCGVRYDDARDDPSVHVSCGMGYVPEIGQRFLHFWTAEERHG